MKKIYALLSLTLLLSVGTLHGEGPRFSHKDPITDREFENVYQDLRSSRSEISSIQSEVDSISDELNIGKILQIVTSTQGIVSTTTSGTYSDTKLSASITPTASTSKILVLVNQTVESATPARTGLRLLRDATTLISEVQGVFNSGATTVGVIAPISYLDSPASSSSLTYKTQFRRINGAGTAQVQSDGDGAAGGSYIQLIEIGQ